MPFTQTQDEYTSISIGVRHINPSIMEGERGHTSLFGKGSAVPIVRYAPTFLVQPSVSGSFKIPSVLICNPGVVDASPSAQYFYQWKADGVDIPGEITNTLITILDFDAVNLTCEVTAVNFLGVAVGLSNGITAELVEPIIVDEQDYYVITGQADDININLDVIDEYPLTGFSANLHQTNFGQMSYIMTGWAAPDHQSNMNQQSCIITGLNQEDAQNLMEFDGYGVTLFEIVQVLTLLNPGAELGDMTNWTTTAGSITAVATAPKQSTGDLAPSEGSFFFMGGDASAFDAVYQDIAVPGGLETDIDLGDLLVGLHWEQSCYDTDNDEAHIYVSFYTGAAALISTDNMLESFATPRNIWTNLFGGMIQIPPLTRTIRVHMEMTRLVGDNNNAYVDDISVTVYEVQSNV